MAYLYIEEYDAISTRDERDRNTGVPPAPIATQRLAVGAASVASAAFQPSTRFAIVTADVAAQFELGAAPIAVAASRYLSADTPRTIVVAAGQKLATIQKQ